MKIPLDRFVKLLGNSQIRELLNDKELLGEFLELWTFDNHNATLIK